MLFRSPHGPPLPSGGSRSRCSRLRCPPVSGARPLRSCARSQSPPPTSSGTSSSAAAAAHLLPPTPQLLSPLLPSTVLALCRLSGKCEAPTSASPSSLLHPHAASPRLRDGFHEVGIGRGQRRRPLLAPSAFRRLDWGDLERDPCKGCTLARARSCVCVSWGGGVVYTTRFSRTRQVLCPQGGARMAVIWGRGLLCTLEHRLLPQWAYDCVWGGGGGESGDDPRNRTCNPISLPRFAISSKEGIDRVLEKMTPCLPLPGSDSSGAFTALGLRRWPTLSSISSFRNPQGTFEGWEWNRRNGEGSRRCHFSRPSPCARLAPRRKQRRAREKTARGSQGGVSKRQGSPGLAMWKDSAAADPGSRARTAAAPHRPAQGLQVHFGAGPILCAPRGAPGLCAPCRRREAGAQGSPLTAAVGVDPGGRGGGG